MARKSKANSRVGNSQKFTAQQDPTNTNGNFPCDKVKTIKPHDYTCFTAREVPSSANSTMFCSPEKALKQM
ncbi:hypothetical protein JCM33374_g5334 [Metschnikowia sp. JCM 33374]|nr:hypothetical protein JCM33374_g5334 [Metschnikowia sp. JCM 33374]